MPDSFGTDTTKKKNTLSSHESEIKKSQSALKAAEGETVTDTKDTKPYKKISGIPKAKPHKLTDPEKLKKKKEAAEGVRKNESSVVPNKKAQRAKGSLAIAKTDYGTHKPLSSADKLALRGAGEKQRDGEKSKGKFKTLKSDSEKQNLGNKKKSSADVTESESEAEELARKESLTDAKMEDESPSSTDEATGGEKEKELTTKEEIPPSNVPSYPYSTCSFFEKIQQGVKAYFSSRNSLGAKPSTEDKSQTKVTEGGNQIDAGVTEEVEEEREANVLQCKNRSRIKLKQSSKISEKVLPKRSRFFTGGQSITFFDARLKTKRNFRIMKCKKLYHPKKSYVRVQIPRKGYFYRSYASLKVSGSSSYLPSRVEPSPPYYDSERLSEVQVSGMAATSPKISSFYEKNLANEEEEKCVRKKADSNISRNFEGYESEDENYTDCDISESESLQEIIVSKEFETLPDLDNLKYLGDLTNQELISMEIDKTANDEGDVSCDIKKEEMPVEESVLSQYLVKCIHGGDYEVFNADQLNENEDEALYKSRDSKYSYRSRSPTPELLSYLKSTADFTKTIANPKNSYHEKNPVFGNSEYSSPVFFEKENCKTLLPYSTKSADNVNEEEKIKRFKEIELKKNINFFFMEDLDLHKELENYLKTVQSNDGSTQIAKARTRNTLQKNQTNWSRENEVFSEENLYNAKTSNLLTNYSTPNNLSHGLSFSEEITLKGTSSQNNLKKTSSLTVNTNQSIKLTSSYLSLDKYNVNKDSCDCLNNMSSSHVKKSNENIFSFSSFPENAEDYLKMIGRCLSNCDNMKTAKSEFDALQINKENTTSKTSIKRSFGKTSFQSVLLKNESDSSSTLWPKSIPVSQILLTSSNQTAMARIDDYEKIFPLTKLSPRRLRKDKYKGMNSNVLFKNLEYSLSSESFRQGFLIWASDFNRSYFKGLNFKHSAASDSTINNEQSCDMKTSSTNIGNKTGLDDADANLSLQDVTDIYNSVLNENEKIKNDSFNSNTNPLFSYVKDLLKEKKLKSDSCNIDSEVLQPYVTLDQKQESGLLVNASTLAKYVNMFQAVLLSSLSINQISNLNNIISGVSTPEIEIEDNDAEGKNEKKGLSDSKTTDEKDNKNNKKSKNQKSEKAKNTKNSNLAKQKSVLLAKRNVFNRHKMDVNIKKDKKILPRNPDPREKKKRASSEIFSVPLKKTNSIKRQSTVQKAVKEPVKKVNEKTNATNIELSSPTELDSILKTHLKLNTNETSSEKKNLKPSKQSSKKLLVTVKMNGDKIMVNSVTRITSDKALNNSRKQFPQHSGEITDLIIEGIPKKQNKKVPALKKNKKIQNKKSNDKIKKQLISKKSSTPVILENKFRPKSRKVRSVPETPKSTLKTQQSPSVIFQISENFIIKEKSLSHPLVSETTPVQSKKKNSSIKKIKKKNVAKEKEEEKKDNNLFLTFEYNQELLKAQHPLEAIVEQSESKLTEMGDRPVTPVNTSQEQRSNEANAKSAKKYFKKLERVDETLRQLFLNNPLFPKLLQSKLDSLFYDLKTSKTAEGEKKISEEQLENASDLKIKNPRKKKNSKLSETSNSVSDILTKSDQKLILKEISELMENQLNNGKKLVEMPFNSNYESYCYVVKNVEDNKKLKTKKKLKDSKSIVCEFFSQGEPKQEKEQKESLDEKIIPNINSKNNEQELQASISKTSISKTNKGQGLKKKNLKKIDTSEDNLEGQQEKKIKKISAEKVPVKNISNNTVLYMNTEISTDCCSVDYVHNDFPENFSGTGSNTLKRTYAENFQNNSPSIPIESDPEGRSNCENKKTPNKETLNKKKKKKAKTVKSNLNLPEEPSESAKSTKIPVTVKNLNGSPEEPVKKLKESPIVIHSAQMEHDDISFPSLMIQSESGLKSHTAFPVTKSQIKNFLKSNSDRKFFPGRVSDNPDEQAPFVTFFLTPRQNEIAGLTSDQAKIVTKEKVPVTLKSKEVPKDKKNKEIDGEISLENVEKFIEYLSKSRKKAMRESARRNNNKKYAKTAKMAQQMKNIKRCRRFLDSIMPTHQSHYPQCNIKKRIINTKVEIEKERKLLKKKMVEESRKIKLRKPEQKASNLPLPSKSVVHSKSSLGNSQNKLTEGQKKTSSGESKSNLMLKKEEKLNSFKSQSHNKDLETQTMSTIPESNEKESNSAAAKNSSQELKTKSKKFSKKYITKSCELLNFVKEVISTAPDTKIKKEVIEVIEDYSKTLQKNLIKKAESQKGKAAVTEKETQEEMTSNKETTSIATVADSEKISTASVKGKTGSKTFTIKIRCNNHGVRKGVSNKSMDCIKEAKKPLKKKTMRLPLTDSSLDHRKIDKEGNINLLDSLIADDSSLKALSKVSSIYFDASDNFLDPTVAHQKEISDSVLLKAKYSENNILQGQNINTSVSDKSVDSSDVNRTVAVSLKHSDIILLSQEPLTNECEEKVFGKIMNYLGANDVNYAMALVKGLLKKSKKCEEKTNDTLKVRNLLKGIESKSKSVIESMEKRGWLKVLSLIEEVALVFNMEKNLLGSIEKDAKLSEKIFKTQNLIPQVSESLKNLKKQVHKSKTFMNIVKSLSETGPLVSNVTYTEQPSFEDIHHRFKAEAAELEKNESLLDEENIDSSNSYINNMASTLENPSNVSGIQQGLHIHKTLNTLGIPERIPSNAELENIIFLNQLKEQIRRQKQYVQILLNSNQDRDHSEVQAIKKKVASYLESLEHEIMHLEATHYSTNATRTFIEENIETTSSTSLASTYATCLEKHKILELGNNESNQLFECRPEKNNDLESSLNYLVLGGLRSFNKSYSTNFEVGPFFNEDRY